MLRLTWYKKCTRRVFNWFKKIVPTIDNFIQLAVSVGAMNCSFGIYTKKYSFRVQKITLLCTFCGLRGNSPRKQSGLRQKGRCEEQDDQEAVVEERTRDTMSLDAHDLPPDQPQQAAEGAAESAGLLQQPIQGAQAELGGSKPARSSCKTASVKCWTKCVRLKKK